jgi:uncharacterized membrane protein (DUF2068 family)
VDDVGWLTFHVLLRAGIGAAVSLYPDIVSRSTKSSYHPALTLATALLAVIGAASAVYGVLELIETRASRAVVGSGAAIILLAYAALLMVVARGVRRGRRWSRAPAIATQLIQLPIAWSFRGGQTSWFALLLAAASLTVIVCVLLPSSTRVFVSEPTEN